MPILLPDDRKLQLPRMHRVSQRLDTLPPVNIAQKVAAQAKNPFIAAHIQPGQSVALPFVVAHPQS